MVIDYRIIEKLNDLNLTKYLYIVYIVSELEF